VLYFSKLKLVTIYSIILFLSFFSFANFVEDKDNFFLSKKVNLGLDLLGGSYLLLEVDTQPVVVQNLQNKLIFLRKELKNLNIKYKNLKVKNATIIFQISKNQVKKFEDFFLNKVNPLNVYFNLYKSYEMDYSITELGELFPAEDKITISYSKFGLIEINNSALDHSLEIVRRRIDEVGTKEPTIIKRGSNRILIELPGLDDPNRIKNLLGKTANLTFRLVSEKDDDFGSEDLFLDDGKGQLRVNKRVMVSGDNLVNAIPKFDSNSNQATVSFTLDRVGAKRFGKVTSQNVGKRLAIILDNKIISAPTIQEPILGGNGQITGDFTFQSATDLALLLRSGALPAPLNIIEERTVGPDLGEDSIRAGSISLAIGFLLVIAYMFFKYKFLGVIANTALIVNLVLLIGILTLLEATLTLPGIAGIILTVGMAVDANVLIFERIKEEMKNEKSNIHAFDLGYKKAQSAVLDANITTLISAIILFFLGSGPVKGFAVTLGIGILTTLFCSYFFARHLSSFYIMKNKDTKITI
jgi:protein-export membrane protein SecD|tara:strand:+ start:768 stop:2345 length:1578 start_codon:yes stop_codon:yes gene_type:complete